MPREIVVIGAGPAGLEAAQAAAAAGARVTLVSDTPLGGRAGWHSLLPSKVWLTLADRASLLLQSETLGLSVAEAPNIDVALMLDRIREIARDWHHKQDALLQALDVRFFLGSASFLAPHRLRAVGRANRQTVDFDADAFIIATGSTPIFPEGMQPDGEQIIAPRFAKYLKSIPDSIVIIGAGPTGCEFAYLFNRLGVRVTWLHEEARILPEFHPEASATLAGALEDWGVQRIGNATVSSIMNDRFGVAAVTQDGRQHTAEIAFVAIGRRPDLQGLCLSAAEVTVVGESPAIDAFCRTSQPHIYLVGDAAGAPMLANHAMAQARVAGRHAAGLPASPFRPESVMAAVYTEPRVAQVGHWNEVGLRRIRLPLTDSLKGRLLADGEGFFELSFDPADGRVKGGVAVGAHATEMLLPVAQAIHVGATVGQLAGLYPAHPTMGEMAFIAFRRAAIVAQS